MITNTSYVSQADAQLYFNGRINTDAWDNADLTNQNKALIQASADIDKLNWTGQKVLPQQIHEFPRMFQDVTIDNIVYDVDNIPLTIKWAVCEQALAYLDGFDVSKEIDSLRLISAGYATVKGDFGAGIVPQNVRAGLCPLAWQFAVPLIRDVNSIAISRV